ncbi:MAG: hypothetical protein DRG24_05805, partial [Epsilonproteobacteria bacterium]
MQHLTIDTIGNKMRYLFSLIIALIFLTGCADLRIAKESFERNDYQQAYDMWIELDKEDHPEATYGLGKLAELGFPVPVSDEQILEYYTQSFANGYTPAAAKIGQFYYSKNRFSQSQEWLEIAMKNESLDAKLLLLQLDLERETDPKLRQKMLLDIEIMGRNGYINANYFLGKFYNKDTEAEFDTLKAIYFFHRAYEDGHDNSGFELAKIYLYDQRGHQSSEQGVALLSELAQKGHARAAYRLGRYYEIEMERLIAENSTQCIASTFKTPHEYYLAKYRSESYRNELFGRHVIPWYVYGAEHDDFPSKLKLIKLRLLSPKNVNTSTQTALPKEYTNRSVLITTDSSYIHTQNEEAIAMLNSKVAQQSKDAQITLARLYENSNSEEEKTQARAIYNRYKSNDPYSLWRMYRI